MAGASGAFSAAGVGVEGIPNPLLAPENRFFAGAVAGGATEKPEKGFDALGAGVALTVWSLALAGKVMRPNRSPLDDVGAFGVAALSAGFSAGVASVSAGFEIRLKRSLPAEAADCEAPVSAGFEIRLKRSLPVGAAGCEVPKRFEPPPKADIG